MLFITEKGGKAAVSCCNTGLALKEEYDNAIKFEALAYGRLIAHKRRHEEVGQISHVRHMQMVTEAARRYAEGDVEAYE